MSEGNWTNPNYLLNTATNATIHLIAQGDWILGSAVVFCNSKPTIARGAVVGVRDLTAQEINVLNSALSWDAPCHRIDIYTQDSGVSNLGGKLIEVYFS